MNRCVPYFYSTWTLATCLSGLSPVGTGSMESNPPVHTRALTRNPVSTWIRTQVRTQMRIQVRTLKKTWMRIQIRIQMAVQLLSRFCP